MNTLLKNTLYATIILLGTSAHITHCFLPDWLMIILFSDSNPKKTLIKGHLNRLEEDLIGKPHERIALVIPERDMINIKILGEAELNKLTHEELQNNDTVDQQLGTVMYEYIKDKSHKIGERETTNREAITKTADAISDSFKTRLQHAPNRNGQALQEFFGTSLEQKVKDGVNHPTYYTYYRHTR